MPGNPQEHDTKLNIRYTQCFYLLSFIYNALTQQRNCHSFNSLMNYLCRKKLNISKHVEWGNAKFTKSPPIDGATVPWAGNDFLRNKFSIINRNVFTKKKCVKMKDFLTYRSDILLGSDEWIGLIDRLRDKHWRWLTSRSPPFLRRCFFDHLQWNIKLVIKLAWNMFMKLYYFNSGAYDCQ